MPENEPRHLQVVQPGARRSPLTFLGRPIRKRSARLGAGHSKVAILGVRAKVRVDRPGDGLTVADHAANLFTLGRIRDCRGKSLWAAEEDSPISDATIRHSIRLYRAIIRFAGERHTVVVAPSVGPSPDGSIHFTWKIGPNRFSINVEAKSRRCTYIVTKIGSEPEMKSVPDYLAAAALVRWLVRGATASS